MLTDEMLKQWSDANEAANKQPEEIVQAQAPEAAAPVEVQETPAQPVVEQPTQQVQTAPVSQTQEVTQELDEEKVFGFLKTKYGIENPDVLSNINKPVEQTQIPEVVKPIMDFVAKTGRNAEDWFYFQSLDPSKLTEEQKVFVGYQIKYPDASNEDIKALLEAEFTLDENEFSEREVKAAKAKLKLKALEATEQINKYRTEFQAVKQPESKVVEDEFLSAQEKDALKKSVSTFNEVKFELPEGKSFAYKVEDSYKQNLYKAIDTVENALDVYIKPDGSFDGETFNKHRTIVDNISTIVSQAFNQGKSEGLNEVKNARSNVQLDPKAEIPQQKDAVAQHWLSEFQRITNA
jgi:hypothetical protein